ISSLTLTDSGLYTCYIPGLADSCTITLTVVRKKDEFTTTRPPVTENTDPEKPGAEKMEDVGAIVGGVLGALIGLGLILIGVLVKLGIIKNMCGTDQQVAANRSQTEKLNPAGNGLINMVSEV
ncbi:butyrophilin-like protein 8 isoform X2, partial [Lates japonicus]